MTGILHTAFDFFTQDFSGFFSSLKIVSIVLSLFFIGGIIYSIIRLLITKSENEEKHEQHFIRDQESPSQKIQYKQWEEVRQLFQSHDSNNWRLAIINADIMLDDLIKKLGYTGATMGEVLKEMQHVPWIQSAWDVHLLRNKLVHEGSRYLLNERESYRAFKIYENIFFETGYLA